MPSFSSFFGTLTNPFSSPSELRQSVALQDYVSQKQQYRMAIKSLKEAEAGLIVAEVVASLEEQNRMHCSSGIGGPLSGTRGAGHSTSTKGYDKGLLGRRGVDIKCSI